jgi:uncharacterized paraquat-inducible protein A
MLSVGRGVKSGHLLNSPGEVTFLILLAVLFLPSFLYVHRSTSIIDYQIVALVWQVVFYRDGMIVFRTEMMAIIFMLYLFLKYLLVFQIYRYCRGRTTRNRTFILAVLSELQWPIMAEIFLIALNIPIWDIHVLHIPIPIVLVICAVLLKIIPRPDLKQLWIEKDETP